MPEMLLAVAIPLFCAGAGELYRGVNDMTRGANESAALAMKTGIWLQVAGFLFLCVALARHPSWRRNRQIDRSEGDTP
ncbi:MAG: hypothetical protein KF696_13375 [Planctomycetes bacterium]|nr:hypothetical protein [Planctomycetota bacterium]MCW8135549.1 hypothetical protein [Planctomycetota bacterium]